MKNMKIAGVALSFCLMGGGALCGCNQVPPYTEGRSDYYAPPQVQLTGPDQEELRNSTAFDQAGIVLSRDEADLLHVTVPVRATGRQILHVQYRVTFLDPAGSPLPGSPTGWFRKTLEPGGWTPITFNSTSPRAQHWQMEMRYAR